MTHREAIESLPWYVNSTLPDAERRDVDEHLAACAECREEVEALRAIRTAEIGLSEQIPVPYPQVPELPRRFSWWFSTPVWARTALAVQLVLCALLWYRASTPSLGTLSGPGATGVQIAIQFDPAVTESVLRQILLDRSGAIVRGPSTQGLYTVSFPIAESDAPALLDALRHTSSVRFAERSR